MLRVLTLSSLFPDASRPTLGPFVERQTLGLAAHPDVDLQVVAPRGLPPFPLSLHPHYRALAALPEQEQWKGVSVHRPRFLHVPGTQGRFDAAAMARALLPLLQDLRRSFAFDVIDAEFFFPDGPAAVQLGEALGVPVSIKARGSDINVWGRQTHSGPQVLDAARRAQGLLAVSAALKAEMVTLGMPEERIAVHYTGVDLDRFVPIDRAAAKAELGIAGPLIACVGGLTVNKRQKLLIDALVHVPDAHLVLIGKGEQEAALRAQAAALGVAARVIFTGAIMHAEIARWLGAADVMALVSASEGLANAWVEALACGTPIVISDAGGAREVLDRPEAGRIVAAEPVVIAEAVRALLANAPDEALVRKAAERFSWDANRDALYAHLARLSR